MIPEIAIQIVHASETSTEKITRILFAKTENPKYPLARYTTGSIMNTSETMLVTA